MPTTLLNDDGTASMATLLMSSHHAFRRDLACLAAALANDQAPRDLLAAEWTHLRSALHGHHTIEDTAMFPGLRAEHPDVAATIDELQEQHRRIDPLLERGDLAFADLGQHRAAARDVVIALEALLAMHLELEEQTITPYLRANKEFPAPADDAALAMYADGFAWSMAGIAPHVNARIEAMLPPGLRARLPAARAAFDERCVRVWGRAHAHVSTTSAS